MLESGLDVGLDLVKRLHMRILLVVNPDDVKAPATLDQVADLALGKRERRFLEFGDGLSAADPAERSAFLRAAWILRVFLREILQLRTTLQLLQQVLGTVLRFRHALPVDLAVWTGQ